MKIVTFLAGQSLVGNKIDLCTDQEIIKWLQQTPSMMSQGKTQGKTPETPLGGLSKGYFPWTSLTVQTVDEKQIVRILPSDAV